MQLVKAQLGYNFSINTKILQILFVSGAFLSGMFNAYLLGTYLEETVIVWFAGVTYAVCTAFFLPIRVQVVGLKIVIMRLLWIVTSIASYVCAVQVTMVANQYLYGGVVGGAILLLGLVVIMKWSKTPIRLLVVFLLPIVGGVATHIALLDPKSLGLLYVVWQSVVSVVIVLGINIIEKPTNN